MLSHVWYAAYGSNVSWARFACYVRGGRPEGARRTYDGCRDTSEPTGRRAIELPGHVIFGGLSTVWGGGMAFYDPEAPGPSYATAYRLTRQQFVDVWCQERRRPLGESLPFGRVVADGQWTAGGGRYDRVLAVGDVDGEPMLTFTFPVGCRPEARPPAPAYVATIETGLVQTRGMTRAGAAAYLNAAARADGAPAS